MTATSKQHPIQPLYLDKAGVPRFRDNAIVRFLLEAGPYDLNRLAVLPFSDEDREQFAQLIGYSLSGFGDLSYVSSDTYARAESKARELGLLPSDDELAGELDTSKLCRCGMELDDDGRCICGLPPERCDCRI